MVLSNAEQSPLMRSTMTVLEAAGLLGIGRSTAYDAAKSGQIPTIRVGTRLVVPTAKIRRMLGLDELDVVEDVQPGQKADVG